MTENNKNLLANLAVALVDNPRATLIELAQAVGISKATLHRFCGTRDKLETLLIEKSKEAVSDVVDVASAEYQDYIYGVKLLIKTHYKYKEFLRYGCDIRDSTWKDYIKAIDVFFMKAQEKETFRNDFGLPSLTEVFLSTVYGLIDSEKRGRIASNYTIETIEGFFLNGTIKKIN